MKIILHKNPALVIFVRLGMALVLAAGLLSGAPAISVRAAGCVVSSTLDDGSAGTLRAAIDDGSCDTITFDAGLAGATITLESTLTLAHDVSIDGSALAAQVSIIGSRTGMRVFYVDPGVTANLRGLAITGGQTTQSGAGIYNAGILTLVDSTVSDNWVSTWAWATRGGADNSADNCYGAGIFNAGVLTVTGSTFSGNEIRYCLNGYGGSIYNSGEAVVSNSTFSGNGVGWEGNKGLGGAICNVGTLTVTGSTFSGNSASFGVVFYRGGTYKTGAHILTNSQFATNRVGIDGGYGGGIYTDGALTVAHSTFSGNQAATSAGGVYNGGVLTVTESTFSGNSADSTGGGIENSGTLTVANSTLFDNHAVGGGISNNGNLTLTNSTLAGNGSGSYLKTVGGGIDNSGTMYFANSIIANSTGSHDLDCLNSGAIGGNTNNLVKDGSCSQGGVKFKKGDPKLGALAANGGPTWTMALLPGSPAINAGDDATCAAAPVNNLDQRGVARPGGLHCDIGAYELAQTLKERARNGGFNTYAGASKIPSGWAAVNFAATDGKSTAIKQEGMASVKMAGRAGVSKTLKQTVALSGVAGDTFIFFFWVRGEDIPAAGSCRAQVLLYNGAALKLTKTVNCPVGTYVAFQNKTLGFTATSAFTKVVIQFTYAKAGGRVWFDGVSLVK